MHKIGNKPIPSFLGTSLGKGRNSAFTLVELIIVITILAILATIGFMSFQGYTLDARDTNRTTSLKVISDGLNIYQAKNTSYPMPDNYITISASGIDISYQGYAGSSVLQLIKASDTKDPIDNSYYTYLINTNKSNFQLMGYLENSVSNSGFGEQVYATDYSSRKITTIGDKLGILVSSGANSPVQDLKNASFTGIDVVNTNTGYTAIFSNTDKITGNFTKLSILKDTSKIGNYDSSLVAYYDMETTIGTGLLADLSGNGNNGIGNGGISIGGVEGNGKNGKSTYFDGTNDYIDLGTFDPSTGNMTISFWLYKESYSASGITEEILAKRDGWSTDLSDSKWTIAILPKDNIYNSRLLFGSPGYSLRTSSVLKLGTWNNYTISYLSGTGNISKWHENGVLIGTVQGLLQANKTNANISIGRAGSQNGEYLLGKLDEVRIYNRALSDSEVQILYNATK